MGLSAAERVRRARAKAAGQAVEPVQRGRPKGVPATVAATKRVPVPRAEDMTIRVVPETEMLLLRIKALDARLVAVEDRVEALGQRQNPEVYMKPTLDDLRQRIAMPRMVNGAKVRACCASTVVEPHGQDCLEGPAS
jgi:hypothetical protein